jgi:uncharacterized Fe-S cluster-containing radical SAM superfamily protein
VIKLPFDPIERAHEVEKIVMQGTSRRYYRFRKANFYGGIITADSVGCDLLCAFCWNYGQNEDIENTKTKLYSPSEVAEKVQKLMEKHDVAKYRISGCEAFLGDLSAQHLAEVILRLEGKKCIIETNGIMLGYDPSILEYIPKKNVHFRVTIKAESQKDFEHITGANAKAFDYQLQALQALTDQKRPFTVAFMQQFVNMDKLADYIDDHQIVLNDDTCKAIDVESLLLYPQNIKSMKARELKVKYDLKARKAYKANIRATIGEELKAEKRRLKA